MGKHKGTKRERILNMLLDAGYQKGVTSTKLTMVSHRFGGIIHNLRQEGYIIDKQERSDNVYTYHLRTKGEPIEKESGIDTLCNIIAEKHQLPRVADLIRQEVLANNLSVQHLG